MTVRGILYLVATPIGNLGDISFRAVEVLKQVAWIACEDTRHSQPLLHHYGITGRLLTVHEHNEGERVTVVLKYLSAGESVALISDAGTPLINDPGFPLVRAAIEAGFRVVPLPGACALISALCGSGLPTHRFSFEGFPPRKSTARIALLEDLRYDPRTLVFYEASHRVRDFLSDVGRVFPGDRPLVIARELTKRFETLVRTTVETASVRVDEEADMQKGEFVILIAGHPETHPDETRTREALRVLKLLMAECSLKTAVNLTVNITGARKDEVYREALRIRSGEPCQVTGDDPRG
ncbi:16S rRNA (cytidine(1402)-2'-O)-methyltransferase [Candidatus Woesearchaeota archaeon]|nr:16S rRNA (cytidine(1402)-2'-O)-methyltransferase [Candidatus Woesearchaeota archaeon]